MQAPVPDWEETGPANGSTAQQASHPGVTFFHLIFKLAAAVYFLFCRLIFRVDSFVTNFIVLLLLVSCDFWVVKNVTGRFLVGLRWWNDNSEGSAWRFEHLRADQREVLRSEKVIFWAGLVGNAAIWVLFTFMTLISPSNWEYLLICVIALMMGGSNLYGYFRCSNEARQYVKDQAQKAIAQAAASVVSAGATNQLNNIV